MVCSWKALLPRRLWSAPPVRDSRPWLVLLKLTLSKGNNLLIHRKLHREKLIGCYCFLIWSVYKFPAFLESLENHYRYVWTFGWITRKYDQCLHIISSMRWWHAHHNIFLPSVCSNRMQPATIFGPMCTFLLCTALSLSSCQSPINTTHLIWVPCVGCVNRNSLPLQCCYLQGLGMCNVTQIL